MNHIDRLSVIVDRLEGLVFRLENPDSCANSSREMRFRNMLLETIQILEATKQAFHSKQLKQLRERVEEVLNEK